MHLYRFLIKKFKFVCKLFKKNNIKIISTGSTSKHIKKLGYNCLSVSNLTKFKEILDGRVKTIHPKIHASLLYKRSDKNHIKSFNKLNFSYHKLCYCKSLSF